MLRPLRLLACLLALAFVAPDLGAQVTLVQKLPNDLTTLSSGEDSTATLSMVSSVTAGDLLTIQLAAYGTVTGYPTITVTDNKGGNTWTKDAESIAGTSDEGCTILHSFIVNGGASFVATVHFATQVTDYSIKAVEWSGVKNAAPATNTNHNDAASSPATSGAATPPAAGNGLYLGCLDLDGASTITEADVLLGERETSGAEQGSMTYANTSGSHNVSWTLSPTVKWQAGTAVFDSLAAGGGADSSGTMGNWWWNFRSGH